MNVELLWEKILELSKKIDVELFYTSHGWIENFKNQHGLATCVLPGVNVNEGTVEQCKEELSILVKNMIWRISLIAIRLDCISKLCF